MLKTTTSSSTSSFAASNDIYFDLMTTLPRQGPRRVEGNRVAMNRDGTLLAIAGTRPPFNYDAGMLTTSFLNQKYDNFYGAIYIYRLVNSTTNPNGSDDQSRRQEWVEQGAIKGTKRHRIGLDVDMSEDGKQIIVSSMFSQDLWIFEQDTLPAGAAMSFKLSNQGLPIEITKDFFRGQGVKFAGDGNTILVSPSRDGYQIYRRKVGTDKNGNSLTTTSWVKTGHIPIKSMNAGYKMNDHHAVSLSSDGSCMVVQQGKESIRNIKSSINDDNRNIKKTATNSGPVVFDMQHTPNKNSTWQRKDVTQNATTDKLLGMPAIVSSSPSKSSCDEILFVGRTIANKTNMLTLLQYGIDDTSSHRTGPATSADGTYLVAVQMELGKGELSAPPPPLPPPRMRKYSFTDMSLSSDGSIIAIAKDNRNYREANDVDIIVQSSNANNETTGDDDLVSWMRVQTLSVGICPGIELQLSLDGTILAVSCGIYYNRQKEGLADVPSFVAIYNLQFGSSRA